MKKVNQNVSFKYHDLSVVRPTIQPDFLPEKYEPLTLILFIQDIPQL
jgi:hypothetical protein